MDVTIQERKFSLRSEYDISSASFSYFAQKTFFSFSDKLELQTQDGRMLAQLQSRFSLLRNKYDFDLSDGRLFNFYCEKIWRGVFACEGDGDSLRLYQHKGLRYSIFQKERQVAAFTKNSLTIGNGNQYDIRMNGNADVVVVVCMILALNTSENDDNRSTVTYDFGSIGPEDRPFDESWEPS